MGFPTQNVITNESLTSEFICPICVNIVEYPVQTSCSHLFCRNCWDEWISVQAQNSRCPKCNASMQQISSYAKDLKECNPLAWRILQRIQVRCPLAQVCSWQGDYGELGPHLINSDTHHSTSGDSQQASADALKEQGNAKFEARAFEDAIKLYSKAIAISPDVANYYSNRAAAWLMLGAPDEAMSDCQQALRLDPAHPRALLRLSKAFCDKGDFEAALQHLSAAPTALAGELERERDRVVALVQGVQAAEAAMAAGLFDQALAVFQGLEGESRAGRLRLGMASCAVMLGNSDRGLAATRLLLKEDPNNLDALALRGWATVLGGDCEQGAKLLREAVRRAPDMQQPSRWLRQTRTVEAALSRARQEALTRQFESAVESFGEALAAGPLPPASNLCVILLAERAATFLRLQNYEACLLDCKGAIEGRSDCKDAWITRASALMALGRPAEAQSELEELVRMFEHDHVVRHWHQKADFENIHKEVNEQVRRLKRPDYYSCLGVSTVASETEIKTAYKARALELHPDKHRDVEGGMSSEEAEARFKLCGEALEVLGDTAKRALYDQGYDKEGLEEKLRAGSSGQGRHGDHRH